MGLLAPSGAAQGLIEKMAGRLGGGPLAGGGPPMLKSAMTTPTAGGQGQVCPRCNGTGRIGGDSGGGIAQVMQSKIGNIPRPGVF